MNMKDGIEVFGEIWRGIRKDDDDARTWGSETDTINMINILSNAALEGPLASWTIQIEAAWQLSHFSQSGFDVWASATSQTFVCSML